MKRRRDPNPLKSKPNYSPLSVFFDAFIGMTAAIRDDRSAHVF